MSKIFVVMGKSAAGKDTIYKGLEQNKNLDLKTVVIYTTRPIREGEQDGREYFFVDEKYFENVHEKNSVIEHRKYNTVYGIWHYFTVDDGQINLEENNYLIIGTLESYEQIKKYFGEKTVVPIYIEIEDGIRLSRALNREQKEKTPKYAEMCRRFLADEKDFAEENIKKLGILKKYNNMDTDKCLQEISKDIESIIKV